MKKIIPILLVTLLITLAFSGCGQSGSQQGGLMKVTDVPKKISDVSKEGIAPNKYIDAYVTKVTDGDTMEVTYKGETQKVRLLCMDTPESVKQGVEVQPYAKEASDLTKSLLLNQSVKLVFDKGVRDRYGRLLAFVFLKDGTFINALLVKNGYARVETVSPNKTHADYFKQLQNEAIRNKAGFWGLPEGQQPFVKDEKGEYRPKYTEEQQPTEKKSKKKK